MSEDKTRQTVVDETKTSAQPEAKVDGARNDGDDLDTLLAQFNQETTKPTPVSPPVEQQQTKPAPAQDPNLARVLHRIERDDISSLVKEVKGDLDHDDEMVEAWIDTRARKDVRLQRAWLERDVNPQAFQRIAKELGREFAKRNSRKIDPQATEDREAVAAAVRGASSNRAPESAPPNYGKMTSIDYRKSVMEQFGFDPGV